VADIGPNPHVAIARSTAHPRLGLRSTRRRHSWCRTGLRARQELHRSGIRTRDGARIESRTWHQERSRGHSFGISRFRHLLRSVPSLPDHPARIEQGPRQTAYRENFPGERETPGYSCVGPAAGHARWRRRRASGRLCRVRRRLNIRDLFAALVGRRWASGQCVCSAMGAIAKMGHQRRMDGVGYLEADPLGVEFGE
jgi:hypothetical protein